MGHPGIRCPAESVGPLVRTLGWSVPLSAALGWSCAELGWGRVGEAEGPRPALAIAAPGYWAAGSARSGLRGTIGLSVQGGHDTGSRGPRRRLCHLQRAKGRCMPAHGACVRVMVAGAWEAKRVNGLGALGMGQGTPRVCGTMVGLVGLGESGEAEQNCVRRHMGEVLRLARVEVGTVGTVVGPSRLYYILLIWRVLPAV